MNNIRDKFEAWAKAHEIDITINPAPSYDARLYNDDETDAMYCGWQAATEQSQKEIEALQAREKELVEALEKIAYDEVKVSVFPESCSHGKSFIDGCDECLIEFARQALANVRGEVK